MSTHYATLGLPANASATDIRQAYRKLVWLTHPDHTPDPAAHARYLAVNEAYEVLSNPSRRASYDAALEWRAAAPSPSFQPTPPRQPEAHPHQPGFRPPTPPTHVRYAKEFAQLLPWLKWVAASSLLLIVLLFADYATTIHLPNETVQRFDYVEQGSRGGKQTYLVFYTEQARFRTPSTVDLEPGDRVHVQQTRWFGKPHRIAVLSGKLRGQSIELGRFGILKVLGTGVLLSALGVLLLRLRPDQIFNFGFVNWVAVGLLLMFYVFH
ncbi:J domain-containing protein [Hymenobacter terrestris]|uniref:J domain-containing protein n=1 Tax=Hymenobacter terrestris TaxID=2748310 RepID=A0ABX2PXT2_9BACT|nr:J domain-containing protein [Hymenobacter terrestris]NVO83466.1 J domain-containing protein [Hymenobacter terrestris]